MKNSKLKGKQSKQANQGALAPVAVNEGNANQDASKTTSAGADLSRLNDLQVGVHYTAPKFLPKGMRDDIERFAFLKACERNLVVRELWPPWNDLVLPQKPVGQSVVNSTTLGIAISPPLFHPPLFDPFQDTKRNWGAKYKNACSNFLRDRIKPFLERCVVLQTGMANPRKRRRYNGKKRKDTISFDTRCDLAVKKHWRGYTWVQLAAEYPYSIERMRKSVDSLLSSLNLKQK